MPSPAVFYIVTPVYNAAAYIDETILSVVTQAGDFSIHYHVQDGGSTDGTIDKIKAWEERLKAPGPWVFCDSVIFSWDSSPDNGMYDAVNKGFERLHIPPEGIMAWMNADDVYMQYAFATAAKAYRDIPEMDWFGGIIAVLLPDGMLYNVETYEQPYPQDLIKDFCCDGYRWRMLQQNGMFWKGHLWEKAGPLDAGLRYAGDFALWPKFAKHAEFVHSPVVLGTFRRRAGQLSSFPEYQAEVEMIRPTALRSQAAEAFLRQHRGGVTAPSLCIDANGKAFQGLRSAFPLGLDPIWWKRVLRGVLPAFILHYLRKVRRAMNT